MHTRLFHYISEDIAYTSIEVNDGSQDGAAMLGCRLGHSA